MLKLTTYKYEASRGLSATAELLVLSSAHGIFVIFSLNLHVKSLQSVDVYLVQDPLFIYSEPSPYLRILSRSFPACA